MPVTHLNAVHLPAHPGPVTPYYLERPGFNFTTGVHNSEVPEAKIFSEAAATTCSASAPFSCSSNSTAGAADTDTCCLNSPGGLFLQTQFWDTDPVTGPDDSWTIHGLWPDKCDGSFDSSCDSSRAYSNITATLQSFDASSLVDYMSTFWVSNTDSNEEFWEHEWSKHGTCISTLEPSCYGSSDYKKGQEAVDFFNATVNLFKSLPTYTWLKQASITPDNSQSYKLSDVRDALSKAHGANVYIGCEDGAINTVYYYFHVKGSVADGDWQATAPVGSTGNCPATVKYPTK